MKTFIADKNCKLSRFLLDAYSGSLSYSAFCRLLRKKDVKVNGKRTAKDVTVSVGDKVEVYFDDDKSVIDATFRQYSTVYEDDMILIVDKNKGVTSENLFERLKNDFGEVYFCHRLDRNTDGIMVFAKTDEAYRAIVEGFKKRDFDKIYLATVYGVFDKKHEVLTAYLTKDAENSVVRVTDERAVGSRLIRTEYLVIDEQADRSTVLVRLLTGRTHQIRAHLKHAGHFILGDGKYGVNRINKAFKIDMLMLTSVKITLSFDNDSPLSYLDGKTFVKKGYENLPAI
ncbi:MAG: RluA family pseudouridine synthase [Clostridia bacterium]|nr:RluA family pseudouridine synthase [Clostridia bacterium]